MRAADTKQNKAVNMRPIRIAIAILPALVLVLAVAAMSPARAADASKPASSVQMTVPSHGKLLFGIFYLAGGTGPHPTAVLLHGFPGYEQNLDIAQFLRARGWNVLALHYRGSWGVKGDFSFAHASADADTEVRFVLDPANALKYDIDTRRVIVIGHSMGGYMAASATAHNRAIAGVVLISAWNPAADYDAQHFATAARAIAHEAKWLAAEGNMLPLAGTSAHALASEIYTHRSTFNIDSLASAISPRPALIITANDGLAAVDAAFAEALSRAGDMHVARYHWNTDHAYSGRRASLCEAVFDWVQSLHPL